MTWYDITNFALIAYCIWAILRRYRSLPYEIKFLLYYFVLTLLVEICSEYFILNRVNNLFLYHLFVPIQYFILCFYLLLLLEQKNNKLIISAITASVLLMLVMSFFVNTLSDYFSFASVLKNLILSFLVLFYFRSVFSSSVNYDLSTNANIWVATGLFINCLGNFFIEGSMNYLMGQNREIAVYFYYLHIGLDFLFYIVFILAITLNFKKSA